MNVSLLRIAASAAAAGFGWKFGALMPDVMATLLHSKMRRHMRSEVKRKLTSVPGEGGRTFVDDYGSAYKKISEMERKGEMGVRGLVDSKGDDWPKWTKSLLGNTEDKNGETPTPGA